MSQPTYYCCALPENISSALRTEWEGLLAQLESKGIAVQILSWTAPQLPEQPPAMGQLFWSAPQKKLFRLPHPNAQLRAVELKGLKEVEDWRSYASQGQFLKGDELVSDPYREKLFISLNDVTANSVAQTLADKISWSLQRFRATKATGETIEQTRRVLGVSQSFSLAALGALYREEEMRALYQALRRRDRDLIEVELKQLSDGLAEGMELLDEQGQAHWLMTERAWRSLNNYQQQRLEEYISPLPIPFEAWRIAYGWGPSDVLC